MKSRGKRTKKSGGHLFPANVNEDYRAWIREQPCCVLKLPTGVQYTRVVCAHLKSRGSGGKDEGNIVPLDWWLHDRLGQIGRTAFEAEREINLAKVARACWKRYQAERGGIPQTGPS